MCFVPCSWNNPLLNLRSTFSSDRLSTNPSAQLQTSFNSNKEIIQSFHSRSPPHRVYEACSCFGFFPKLLLGCLIVCFLFGGSTHFGVDYSESDQKFSEKFCTTPSERCFDFKSMCVSQILIILVYTKIQLWFPWSRRKDILKQKYNSFWLYVVLLQIVVPQLPPFQVECVARFPLGFPPRHPICCTYHALPCLI